MTINPLADHDELFSTVHALNTPRQMHCPDCGLMMVRKKQKKNKNSKFWGCLNWPSCQKTVDYYHEDDLAFVDYYNPNQKEGKGFSGNLYDLKYRYVDKKIIETFSEKLYEEIETRIGLNEFDFCVSIPNSGNIENKVIAALRNSGPLGQLKYCEKVIEETGRESQKDAKTLRNRMQNVKGKYRIRDKDSLKGTRGVLILDDIVTSGSSVHEVSFIIHEVNEKFNYAGCIGKNRRI